MRRRRIGPIACVTAEQNYDCCACNAVVRDLIDGHRGYHALTPDAGAEFKNAARHLPPRVGCAWSDGPRRLHCLGGGGVVRSTRSGGQLPADYGGDGPRFMTRVYPGDSPRVPLDYATGDRHRGAAIATKTYPWPACF